MTDEQIRQKADKYAQMYAESQEWGKDAAYDGAYNGYMACADELLSKDVNWRRGRKKGNRILAVIKAPGCVTIYRVLNLYLYADNGILKQVYRDQDGKAIPNEYIKRYAIIKE